jgi:hypothetical protein
VDLLRGELERRELLDLRLVEGGTVGKRRRAQGGSGVRQVLGADEGQEPAVGRNDDIPDDGTGLAAQRRLVGGRNRGRYRKERRIQRVRRVRLDVRLDGAVAADHGDARYGIPSRHPRSHVRDVFVEVPWHVAQAREVVTVYVDRAEPLARCELSPEKRVAVERRFVRLVPDVVGQGANRCPEHLSVDTLLRRKLVERNAVERSKRALPILMASLLRRRIYARECSCRTRLARFIAPSSHFLLSPCPLGGIERTKARIGRSRGRGLRRRDVQ